MVDGDSLFIGISLKGGSRCVLIGNMCYITYNDDRRHEDGTVQDYLLSE